MTVQIPPVDLERELSVEQRREIVLAYAETKHGQKAEFLRAAGVSRRQLYRWRRQLAAGTLDMGLQPRENIAVNNDIFVEFSRLSDSHQALEEQYRQAQALIAKLESKLADAEAKQAENAELKKLVAEKEALIASQVEAVTAMGKAIAAMPNHFDR